MVKISKTYKTLSAIMAQPRKSVSNPRHTPAMVHYLPRHLAGELSSDHKHLIPNSTSVDPQTISAQGKFQMAGDTIQLKPIYVRTFMPKQYTTRAQTALICNTIKNIFLDETPHDDDTVRLYLQALLHIVGSQVAKTSVVKTALERAGFELNVEILDQDDEEMMNGLNVDAETQACKNIVGLQEVSNPHVVMLAYCGAIVLLAGKQLNKVSADPWTKRRVRGLSASMGTTIDMSRVASFHTSTATKVYQKLSLLLPLKSAMVRLLFGLARQRTVTGNLAGAMLNLLSWAEMNHIKMVQEYIFERYPELLAMKQLQGSCLEVLRESWEFLNSLPEHERPYAKLLYGPMQTKALQRDRFVLLIDAAHAVGAYLHSSFKNYQGDTEGSAGQAIKKAVTEYLDKLSSTGQMFAQSATVATTKQGLLDNLKKSDDIFNQISDALDIQVNEMVRN